MPAARDVGHVRQGEQRLGLVVELAEIDVEKRRDMSIFA
jgi:hypothetical protein